jgi:ABC-type sugar transport system permease subunit
LIETDVPSPSSGARTLRTIVGLLLIVPASIACLLSFLLPTLQLASMSFQDVDLFDPSSSEFIGIDNYARVGEMISSGDGIVMTLLVLVVRVLAVAIVQPLVAFGAAHSVPALRLVTRLILTVPLALYAPFLTLMAWYVFIRPEPDSMRGMLLMADGLMTLTLATAVMLPAYLAALRDASRRSFAILWGLSVLAVIALSLQSFAVSYAVQGGPRGSTNTLMMLLFRLGFTNMQIGAAAAMGILILIPVTVLGVIAALIIVLSGLHIRMERNQQPALQGGLPVALGAAMVLLALIGCALSALPFGAQIGAAAGSSEQLAESFSFARGLFNTLGPPLLSVLMLQLPLTYLAALGIGGLRPFGRRSEFLLLPFSPWLFATVGPLSLIFLFAARDLGMVDSFAGLLLRFGISIPMLFILTLFFKGQMAKRAAAMDETQVGAGGFVQQIILPSLPLALLLAAAAVLIAAQSILWPLIASNSPDQMPLPVWAARMLGQFGGVGGMISGLLLQSVIPIAILFLLLFAVFQVVYLPHLMVERQVQDSVDATAGSDMESADTVGMN